MPSATLCVCADEHQNEVCLHLLDQADGHRVVEALTVTNNRPGAEQAIAIAHPSADVTRLHAPRPGDESHPLALAVLLHLLGSDSGHHRFNWFQLPQEV
jgi:hypothetical protein